VDGDPIVGTIAMASFGEAERRAIQCLNEIVAPWFGVRANLSRSEEPGRWEENAAVTSKQSEIRVLVVDDSLVMRQLISDVINEADGMTVIGTARNGIEALQQIRRESPDVVTLDIQMPEMDGLSALDEILKVHPIPIIIVSALSQRTADVTLDAIQRGAMEYVTKPQGISEVESMLRHELVRKIRTIATTDVRRVLEIRDERRRRQSQAVAIREANKSSLDERMEQFCIAIGISTGGPPALTFLMEKLHPPLPPILIVQHMPAEFTGPFSRRLNAVSSLEVKEATTRDVLRPNCVFVAPGGRHMSIRGQLDDARIIVRDGPVVSGHRPSVDVMMKSVAKLFGKRTLGVIMTGMGRDGVDGCQAIQASGGFVLGQDEATSDVYGMNKAAYATGNVDRQFGLSQLPKEISVQLARMRNAYRSASIAK